MPQPILGAATPKQHKLDVLRQHFPQTVDESHQAQITVFAKLPKINIPTPVGHYNPDFGYAIAQGS